MRNRQEEDFLTERSSHTYVNKMVVNDKKFGNTTLTNLQESGFASIKDNRTLKKDIESALTNKDKDRLSQYSNSFYKANGMYTRLCEYFAGLYKYDWMIVPYEQETNDENFWDALKILERSKVKKMAGHMASVAIREGAYYGYVTGVDKRISIQDLPYKYCRSRFKIEGLPIVEFNAKFFDDWYINSDYRNKVLKSWPKEFGKGYADFHKGKLTGDANNERGWFTLSPGFGIQVSATEDCIPLFANTLPSLIDLAEGQEMDRQKTMQQLTKIIVQKLPLDKNFEMVFDMDEATDIHSAAVQMLRKAVGIDVLTTFADIKVEEMATSNSSVRQDDLEKVERTAYNAMGISQNLFNTSGNLALEKSVENDSSFIKTLVQDIGQTFENLTNQFLSDEEYTFEFLPTTIYNYKEFAKMYKEQVQYGYSRLLPALAMGQTQFSILRTLQFEQNLKLDELMVPPLSSATMSGKDKESAGQGRPEMADEEKSDKTILNKESAQ